MCCGCVSMPTSAANLEAEGSINEYQKDKDLARSQAVVPSDSSIALTLHRPLYPPGRIIHVVRHHAKRNELVLILCLLTAKQDLFIGATVVQDCCGGSH